MVRDQDGIDDASDEFVDAGTPQETADALENMARLEANTEKLAAWIHDLDGDADPRTQLAAAFLARRGRCDLAAVVLYGDDLIRAFPEFTPRRIG